MKLELITDELKNNIADFVKTEAKEASVLWLRDKAFPAICDVAKSYTEALIKSSEQETGWCKFRDRVFLPCTVELALWLIGKALDGMAAKQGK